MFEKLFSSNAFLLLFFWCLPAFVVAAWLHFPKSLGRPSFEFFVLPAVRLWPCCSWSTTLPAAVARPCCVLKITCLHGCLQVSPRCQECGVSDVPLDEDPGYRGGNLVLLCRVLNCNPGCLVLCFVGQIRPGSGGDCGEAKGYHVEARYIVPPI